VGGGRRPEAHLLQLLRHELPGVVDVGVERELDKDDGNAIAEFDRTRKGVKRWCSRSATRIRGPVPPRDPPGGAPAADLAFDLRIGGRVDLVCWGVMPSGMLRHSVFILLGERGGRLSE
jgi:hypothetical protein